MFDDSAFPTLEGGAYEAALQLGKRSVHLSWLVTVSPYPGQTPGELARLRSEHRIALEAARVAEEPGMAVGATVAGKMEAA